MKEVWILRDLQPSSQIDSYEIWDVMSVHSSPQVAMDHLKEHLGITGDAEMIEFTNDDGYTCYRPKDQDLAADGRIFMIDRYEVI